jgi:hypothetical protein
MASTGAPPGGSLPLADITGRMSVFSRLFCDAVGLAEPQQLLDARSVVEVVQGRVPRTTEPAEDAPVFEAAAFVGEWLRAWSDAVWIAEGPFEPHLQIVAPGAAVVYLLPLVSIVRVASTAGYDGLPELLESVLADVRDPPGAGPVSGVRVAPPSDRARVAAWIERHRHLRDASRASLWRRCLACASRVEDSVTLHVSTNDWERDASAAAEQLANRPFACECGGAPGDVSRFLMLRSHEGELRVADIYLGGTHTRVSCWSLEGDRAVPLDATALDVDGLVA